MMAKKIKRTERRYSDTLTLVERRKGKVWMYAQIALCVLLGTWLLWLLR